MFAFHIFFQIVKILQNGEFKKKNNKNRGEANESVLGSKQVKNT